MGERRKLILMLAVAGIVAILTTVYFRGSERKLQITEYCRKTEKVDTNGLENDFSYVVVKNNAASASSTGRVYLSDSMDDLKKVLLSGQILPGDEKRIDIPEANSLDIRKQGGSTVYLSDESGRILDSVEIPALKKDEAYVYTDSGWRVSVAGKEGIRPPIFSAPGGFYDSGFELALTSPDDCDIYYTLDGSTPTSASTGYSGVIRVYDRSSEENVYLNIPNVISDWPNHMEEFATDPVDKAFVVRAACINSEGVSSSVVTNVYFVGLDKYKDKNVVSLVADPDDLFGINGIYSGGYIYDKWYEDNMSAILANPKDGKDDEKLWNTEPEPDWEKGGDIWERRADLGYFEEGRNVLSQPVGIRIQGHAARDEKLKRFSIFSRKKYSGSRYFDSPVFAGERSHALVLREGDANALMQTLVADRDVLTMPVKRVSVFLNGEFWYDTYMLEKATETLISNKYDVNETNIAIVKNGGIGFDVLYGDNPFTGISDHIENNDLSVPENYEHFGELADIQSFIDSSCIYVYSANGDYQERWNNYYWHTIYPEDDGYGDSRWRWGMYDMDNYGQGISSEYAVGTLYEIDPFTMRGVWQSEPITEWPIYSSLRTNENFCRQFVLTFMDLVNTDFRYDNVREKMDLLQITDPDLDDFYKNRADYAVSYMAEEFELEGSLEKVEIFSDHPGQTVKLNTILPELDGNAWTGEYFTDYPVTVTALDAGFDHWEIEADGETTEDGDRTVMVPVGRGGVRIHAVYM